MVKRCLLLFVLLQCFGNKALACFHYWKIRSELPTAGCSKLLPPGRSFTTMAA